MDTQPRLASSSPCTEDAPELLMLLCPPRVSPLPYLVSAVDGTKDLL